MFAKRRWLLCSAVFVAACGGDDALTSGNSPSVAVPLVAQAAVLGVPFTFDVAPGFVDPKRQGLTYSASFTPANTTCLSFANGRISGTPDALGIITAKIVAHDAAGDSATQTVAVVVFAQGLTAPVLPANPLAYADLRSPLPTSYLVLNGPGGSAIGKSNAPPTNQTTDAGATLGRVLFHDTRLSANDRVSCASCHVQKFGFADTAQFSTGFAGGKTPRHSPGIANTRFYVNGRAFWDDRAASLEAQALLPIQNAVEMGLTLDQLVLKVKATSFYPPLFQAAFGTSEVTTMRVSQAIAQYVRSIVSYGSRFDSLFPPGAVNPNIAMLTAQEAQGLNLFNGQGRCAQCHWTNAHASDNPHNTGLDASVTDTGSGSGRFKAPSLRNVDVRGRFMHDGRFTSLNQVVAFYSDSIQPNPFLDGRLRTPNGAPIRFAFTAAQRDAIVAYLRTLTDQPLLKDARFSNPFP